MSLKPVGLIATLCVAVVGASPVIAQERPDPVGKPPELPANANANIASVVEAVTTRQFPERRSPLIMPPPFNGAAFAANPQAYLNVVEPGRVFQSAAPGLQTPVLRTLEGASFMIAVGESCTLKVQTAPNAPVSFLTMDLGTFSNGLTAITVRADQQGVATATYSASDGVIADVNILAGSPMASGQVQFHVVVTEQSVSDQ